MLTNNTTLVYDELGEISPEELIQAAIKAGAFAFDLETTGVNPRNDRIEGISFYVPGKKPVRAWFPFVNGTMNVKTYNCNACGWATYKEEDCEVVTKRAMSVLQCAKCNKKVTIGEESLRPALHQRDTMERLRPLFENENLICVGHNMKFDMAFLIEAPGTDRSIYVKCKLGDSMIAHYLQDENLRRYGLKQSVERVFGVKLTTYKEAANNESVFSFALNKPLGVYAQDDAEWSYKLYDWSLESMRFQDTSGRLEKIFWDLEMKVTRIVMEMELTGVLIDWEWLVKVSEDLERKKAESYKIITELSGRGLNLNSPHQVSEFMYDKPEHGGLGLPTHGLEMGKNGCWPTGDKVIKHFARSVPAVNEISKYRSLDTVKSGFADKLVKLAKVTGRVHSRFNQTGTVIGRFSSSDPINFQNQPRDRNLIRKAFCAYLPDDRDPEMLMFGADYSQIELRVVAHLANERNMIEVYGANGVCTHNGSGEACQYFLEYHECEDTNKKKCKWKGLIMQGVHCPDCDGHLEYMRRCRHVDLHQRTAEDAGVPRNPLAKNLNFGCLYRIGPRRFVEYADLYEENGEPKLAEAADLISRFYTAYPGIPIFHNRIEQEVKSNGWLGYTITKRRRRLNESRLRLSEYKAITQAVQFAVSGSAQDIMKVAMIRIFERIRIHIANSQGAVRKAWEKVKFLLQVHDEIILQGPKSLEKEIKHMIKTEMEGAANLVVPIPVDVKSGRCWDDIH